MTNGTTADATLALKGMLGIGVNVDAAVETKRNSHHGSKGDSKGKNRTPKNTTTTTAINNNINSNNNSNSNSNSVNQSSNKTTTSKKNPNSNKKKKKQKEGTRSNENAQYVKSNQNKPQPPGTGSKKGKKKKPMGDTNKGKNKPRNVKDENYAMSAFQSPPDASTLPLPAFGSSFNFGEEADTNGLGQKQSQSQQQVDLSGSSAPAPNPAAAAVSSRNHEKETSLGDANTQKQNEPSTTKIMISSEKRTENEIKAILNISNQNDNVLNEEKVVEQSDVNSGPNKTTVPMKEQRHPSGVNLAKLTISAATPDNTIRSHPHQQTSNDETMKRLQTPTSNTRNPPTTPNSKDPIAMLMNAQSYGTANPSFNNHYHSAHQSYNMYPSHQQHSPHYHLHTPPFFTIQVQVPPMLMPGRRMMIPGSPMTGGYPINIVVPEGVVPGMVIPVSIANPNSRGGTAIPHH